MCRAPRQFCDGPSGCHLELIHRDHRKFYESSSGFGQIMNRDYGRGAFGFADVDLVFRHGPADGRDLLVIMEHKELTAEIKSSQARILRSLAVALHVGVLEHRFHPKSGVYVIRGRIGAATDGHRETYLDGPQTIDRMLPMADGAPRESWVVNSQDELFAWLDALHGTPVHSRQTRRSREAS